MVVPDCTNPVWPCALTGAAACLAGIQGLRVVIHGSSGCYYYPKSLIKAPLTGSFILEKEVIFGAGDRLRQVVKTALLEAEQVAVVNSCVPALMGEDLAAELAGYPVILVDSPGFVGNAEAGYGIALESLLQTRPPAGEGVNIGGICLLDLFWRGNMHEAARILALAGIPIATVFSWDQLGSLQKAGPVTVTTNPDYGMPSGRDGGTLLGIENTRNTVFALLDTWPDADPDPLIAGCDRAEELVIAACEKYLRRNDPPLAVICAQSGYAGFFSDLLTRYLGAERPCILPRNETDTPAVTDLDQIKEALERDSYNLLLGSSYEQRILPDAGFIGITPPDRSRVVLGSRPLAGPEGTLHAAELVLNACLDRKKRE
nr:nitrogenase component 1 [Methanocalculus sp. AMF5]